MMQFSRVISLSVLFALGTLVLATPLSQVGKRDNAAIENVVRNLKSSTDTILPQISALGTSGNATSDTVAPLIGQLTTALGTASTDLGALDSTASSKRQTNDDIADLLAGIIEDIANALDTLLGDASAIPDLGGLLAGVDTSLDQVLTGLEILLAGVLNLVANLLVDVAGLLEQLAFGLTLASLGL